MLARSVSVRAIALMAVVFLAISSAGCAPGEPPENYWDLVVRDYRERTTGFSTLDRPVRGYPGTMSGTSLPPPVVLADDVVVHSPLTEEQLLEGARIQEAAMASDPDRDGMSAVLDGFRSCLDSVGGGYGHRLRGHALSIGSDGSASITMSNVDFSAYDSFDDLVDNLSIDCRKLYVNDYVEWLNDAIDLGAVDWNPCRDASGIPDWRDPVLSELFDPESMDLSVRCTDRGDSILIASL